MATLEFTASVKADMCFFTASTFGTLKNKQVALNVCTASCIVAL